MAVRPGHPSSDYVKIRATPFLSSERATRPCAKVRGTVPICSAGSANLGQSPVVFRGFRGAARPGHASSIERLVQDSRGETTLNRQVRFSVFPREDCDCGRQFSPVGALATPFVRACHLTRIDAQSCPTGLDSGPCFSGVWQSSSGGPDKTGCFTPREARLGRAAWGSSDRPGLPQSGAHQAPVRQREGDSPNLLRRLCKFGTVPGGFPGLPQGGAPRAPVERLMEDSSHALRQGVPPDPARRYPPFIPCNGPPDALELPFRLSVRDRIRSGRNV